MEATPHRHGIRVLAALVFIVLPACSLVAEGSAEVDPELLAQAEVWTGPRITFSKAAGANPGVAANQDRITDTVWITRGNEGGQIYNAVVEGSANSGVSPADTLWAIGTLDNVRELAFRPFRSAVRRPREVVGLDLVLYLVQDNVLLEVEFLSWDQEKQGGFSYQRSTPPE